MNHSKDKTDEFFFHLIYIDRLVTSWDLDNQKLEREFLNVKPLRVVLINTSISFENNIVFSRFIPWREFHYAQNINLFNSMLNFQIIFPSFF